MQENNFYIYRYWIIVGSDSFPWSYVGKTHKSQASRRGSVDTFCGYKDCRVFYSAVHKYGPRNFQYEVIESGLTEDEAFEREKYWIQYYNSIEHGFNRSSGGKGNTASPSEEAKKKISQSLIGVNINNLLYSKPVFQFTLDGQLIAEYPSIHEAARQTGFMREHIRDCCTGRRKSTGGSVFKRKEN